MVFPVVVTFPADHGSGGGSGDLVDGTDALVDVEVGVVAAFFSSSS
jgi:hypothetical protein